MTDAHTPPLWRRLLLTGAAGEIGGVLRPALRGVAERLRLHDLRPLAPEAPEEEAVQGDLAEPGVALEATRDVDCVVHLAGVPRETGGTPEQILRATVLGCHALFEAARANGARRLVVASSNHVIGFYRSDRPVGTEEPARPSGHYGVSKVFGEAMSRLYADKFGMEVACLRHCQVGCLWPERSGWAKLVGCRQTSPPTLGTASRLRSSATRCGSITCSASACETWS